jgi:hypothetical protein
LLISGHLKISQKPNWLSRNQIGFLPITKLVFMKTKWFLGKTKLVFSGTNGRQMSIILRWFGNNQIGFPQTPFCVRMLIGCTKYLVITSSLVMSKLIVKVSLFLFSFASFLFSFCRGGDPDGMQKVRHGIAGDRRGGILSVLRDKAGQDRDAQETGQRDRDCYQAEKR